MTLKDLIETFPDITSHCIVITKSKDYDADLETLLKEPLTLTEDNSSDTDAELYHFRNYTVNRIDIRKRFVGNINLIDLYVIIFV